MTEKKVSSAILCSCTLLRQKKEKFLLHSLPPDDGHSWPVWSLLRPLSLLRQPKMLPSEVLLYQWDKFSRRNMNWSKIGMGNIRWTHYHDLKSNSPLSTCRVLPVVEGRRTSQRSGDLEGQNYFSDKSLLLAWIPSCKVSIANITSRNGVITRIQTMFINKTPRKLLVQMCTLGNCLRCSFWSARVRDW